MEKLINNLKHSEGFRPYIYLDTLGKKTIGYGFLVSSLKADELALNDGKVEPMSSAVAEKILRLKVKKLTDEVLLAIGWLEHKPQNVQNVIFEMAYQLGIKGVLEFKNTLNFIQKGDYVSAGKNMRSSRWYRQTPRRVERLISLLQS